MSLKRIISTFILATVCLCSMSSMNAGWWDNDKKESAECKEKCKKNCCMRCHKAKNRCLCKKNKEMNEKGMRGRKHNSKKRHHEGHKREESRRQHRNNEERREKKEHKARDRRNYEMDEK